MEIKEGFFIRRPIFATVLSIIITLVGLLAIKVLPVEQYPNLTPPQVVVRADYSGASADVVAESVASLLESQINGVDNMIYMSSVSSGTGSMTLTVTFDIGTDPDQATINVNNRVQLAVAQLPQEVQRLGITVVKSTPSILMLVFLTSPDNRYDTVFLSNYALLNVVDELKLVHGVGDVQNFASQNYAIRVWLDPEKMAKFRVTPAEIAQVIRNQNSQFAAGRIGEPPMYDNVSVTWQIITKGRLSTPEEFGDIIVRAEPDGSSLRLKDLARVELGAESYNFVGRMNGKEAVPVGIYLAPGANALSTATAVEQAMEKLAQSFPDGVSYDIPYNTTTFIKISIDEVVKTLIEAMVLVFIVVFIFLQNWRATLIPCLAVPVAIIGTFAGMYVLGFTINTLTMFGLVLAIGMVVDDAIVVLENVERHMSEGLPPRQATAKAMQEVTRPVIAIVLVLCAVFIPVAFTGGIAGKMYQQFAITIAISVVISGIVALTFTPAMCALILRPNHGEPARPFRAFNRWFERVTDKYVSVVMFLMHRLIISIVLFAAMSFAAYLIFVRIPGGLVPDEDQGYLMGLVILPDGASLSRTAEVVSALDSETLRDPIVQNVMSFSGMDILSGSLKTNYGSIFITLKPWEDRKKADQSSYAMVQKYFAMGAQIPEGMVMAFNPPPIMGMSTTGGFEMYLQNRIGASDEEMFQVVRRLEAAANERPELSGVSSTYSISSPQLYVALDRQRALSMGVNVADVFDTMASTFGASYVNDFNLYGRTFRVYTQSDQRFRAVPDDIRDVYVRNNAGKMVPLTSLVTVENIGGAQTVQRFNNFPAAKFMGSPASGYSSGQAMTVMEEVAREVLPQGFTVAWAGTSYQEQKLSGSSAMIFGLAILMVFLILAAQYESWSLPATVLGAVPFAVFGAALATWFRGYENDIYFQVALVTLVGLSAKNAILIVEFAVDQYHLGGRTIEQAAEEGARLRFRPIIMTSLAFIFGCVPLALSSGAGAASRHAIGTSVIGGMIAATVLAPLFVPFFFKIIMGISARFSRKRVNPEKPNAAGRPAGEEQ